MTRHTFEHSPAYLAATKFYAALMKLDATPGSYAARNKLERVGRRMGDCIADAIELPTVTVKRLATAFACSVNARSTLTFMRAGNLIEELAHQRAIQLLEVLLGELEVLQQWAEGVKPAALTAAIVEPLDTKAAGDTPAPDEAAVSVGLASNVDGTIGGPGG